jgi:hypothetical protein
MIYEAQKLHQKSAINNKSILRKDMRSTYYLTACI